MGGQIKLDIKVKSLVRRTPDAGPGFGDVRPVGKVTHELFRCRLAGQGWSD